MRAANLFVSLLGIVSIGLAATLAWRWRRLPLLAISPPAADTPGSAALDGVRTLAAVMASGVLAGALVPGLGARLVMRILAATSGRSAQGTITAADQVVGEITSGGTLAVVFFVGILGGVGTALAFMIVRQWMPTTAGPTGVVIGILLLGTLGVTDALSPDNRDFTILRPTWLAVTLVVAVALLFGVTFAAFAARLTAGMPTMSRRPSSIASHAALIIFMIPLLFISAAGYVTGRAVLRGRLVATITSPAVQRVGHTAVGVATILATAAIIRAIVEIVSA